METHDHPQVLRLEPAAAAPPPAARARLAFAPLHKRAFGTAVGAAAALVLAAATAFHVVVQPTDAPDLSLLAHYFYGYRVDWAGVAVGAAWAFGVGFTAGWFLAFCRNLALATAVFLTRTREELRATRDFLDHV